MTTTTATYVFGLIAHRTRSRRPVVERLPGAGVVRMIPVKPGWWLVACDVPLDTYGDAALRSRLTDLDWVSAVAVAHERIVERFLFADAVLPMKLFTMFRNDERASGHMLAREVTFDAVVARVAKREEWGVRIALRRAPGRGEQTERRPPASGAGYLRQKKAQRNDVTGRARRAREVASDLFDTLSGHAIEARRRPATELAADGGPLVLDAAFLVQRTKAARLRAAAARHARELAPQGFDIAITGPWPPYSFVQD